MLWAVAAASPATTTMAGTMLMAKAPRTILIRYSAPAILASWRGGVPPMEFINDLPSTRVGRGGRLHGSIGNSTDGACHDSDQTPQEVTWCDGCEIAFGQTPQATRWRVRRCAAGATVMPGLELTLARLT